MFYLEVAPEKGYLAAYTRLGMRLLRLYQGQYRGRNAIPGYSRKGSFLFA